MSRKKVIVKRLNSIQNLGAMDVLCTDKTGTLTHGPGHPGKALRRRPAGGRGRADAGLPQQPLPDRPEERAGPGHPAAPRRCTSSSALPEYAKVDEIPFDFSRKHDVGGRARRPTDVHRLICKGARRRSSSAAARFELDGEVYPIDHAAHRRPEGGVRRASAPTASACWRWPTRTWTGKPAYSKDDEQRPDPQGYVAFLDPPKDTAAPAIAALQKHGVAVKVLTGDNELVSRKICREVGIATDHVLLGSQVEAMTDAELAEAADKTTLCSPGSRRPTSSGSSSALQSKGHVVGFLGDGINDAPALRAADVGISVDTAVDIAKESADVILLEKSLLVLEEGVLEGRKVFANILKYIRMGASSNFGNMFSVLGASIFLPFLPMAPIQILTNNLLYDFSQVPIPTDEVDPEQIAKPRPWSMSDITRFILFIGPCSSIFDYTTYLHDALRLRLLGHRPRWRRCSRPAGSSSRC